MPTESRPHLPIGRRSDRWDLMAAILGWSCTLLVVAVFLWMIGGLVAVGFSSLQWSFLWGEPTNFGKSGGIGTIIVSTTIILLICLASALPLGICTAAWLSEVSLKRGWVRTVVSRSLDLLAAVPSVVFGLFGMIFFCQTLKFGFSILAGGLTLALMILPIVVTTVYTAFQSVPNELRSNATALGLSQTTTMMKLLLPAAAPGVIVGTVLGVARAMAETAALIFTSGAVTRMPESVFDSGRSLSIHIYDLAFNVSGGEPNAAATALVLMGALALVNSIASWLANRWLRGQSKQAT